MNQELTVAYLKAVEHWRTLREMDPLGTPPISAPHLIDEPPGYGDSHYPVMIVGQETKGWGETIDPRRDPEGVLAELRAWYRGFALGAKYRPTPFWQAANKLFKALNSNSSAPSYLWSNLYKMDVGAGRPPVEIEAAPADTNLLPAELVAFNPRVVVFFTGPNYDRRLLDIFPGATFALLSNALAHVSHPSLPLLSFRTYHPKYLRLSRNWGVLDELVSACHEVEP